VLHPRIMVERTKNCRGFEEVVRGCIAKNGNVWRCSIGLEVVLHHHARVVVVGAYWDDV
jgi:hypothetical protein